VVLGVLGLMLLCGAAELACAVFAIAVRRPPQVALSAPAPSPEVSAAGPAHPGSRFRRPRSS
jgi:hypothetical protein